MVKPVAGQQEADPLGILALALLFTKNTGFRGAWNHPAVRNKKLSHKSFGELNS